MTVLRESPWYEEILKEGLEKGEQQGLQQGLQRGRQQEAETLILRQLERRLGEIEFSIKQKIQRLSIAQLEILGENLIDFSNRQDLLNYLENLD